MADDRIRNIFSSLRLAEDPRVSLDVEAPQAPAGRVYTLNPTTGRPLASVRLDSKDETLGAIAASTDAFKRWREVPAPERGQVVRAIGERLRSFKEPLGELVTLEMGKLRSEGLGEVQETIDIADFAVGLSRQLPGQVFPSERAGHRMFEQWLPLGPIGVITAFNFPNAVWGWNAMLAAIAGDTTIWKPSLFAPLVAIATNHVADEVATEMGHPGVFSLVIGTDDEVGETLVQDKRVPLISATGSCRMGRHVSQNVAARLGRCLLELGGNNAVIVEPDADLDLAIKSILFGSVGTCGQRCTSTRRLLLHESIADDFEARLASAFAQVRLGDPLESDTLVGPLVHSAAQDQFLSALDAAKEQGAEILAGGRKAEVNGSDGQPLGGAFVHPALVRAPASGDLPIAMDETFAPILYTFRYKTLEQAIDMQNSVDQGLSSAIFTSTIAASERFLAPSGAGSDCGLAYVNTGTSGAEIGGAFGGEKDTGGGRESGSDAWKAYMRRQTCTINFGGDFQLAQGIEFG
ncbi:MAG: aldehyde dehydrogenase family protein [Planctomycetota bacterium]